MGKKFRIACHLCGWPQDVREDREKVMRIISEAGYEGVEGFDVKSPEDLVNLACLAARFNLRLLNVRAPDFENKLRFSATLGNDALEVPALKRSDFGGTNPSQADFERAAEALRENCRKAAALHLKPFHHTHVGLILETLEDADRLLPLVPELHLLLDTGHLKAAHSEPIPVIEKWSARIAHVHLKNFYAQDPKSWDHNSADFSLRSRSPATRAGFRLRRTTRGATSQMS